MTRIFSVILLLLSLAFNAQDKLNYIFDHVNNTNGFPAKNIQCMTRDVNGNIWMITEKGLLKYNGHSGKFYGIKKDSTGLLPSPAFSIYADKQGIVWIGYLDLYISSFNPVTEKFTHYLYKKDWADCFPEGGANMFLEDSKGNFWIAVWGGGLSNLDRKTGKFTTFKPDTLKKNTISTFNTTCITEQKDGTFLIGSWEGNGYGKFSFLQTFDPKTKEFIRFPVDDYKFVSEEEKRGIKAAFRIIQFIYPENDNIWVSTFLGVVCIDKKNKTITRYSGYAEEAKKNGSHVAYENGRHYVVDGRNLWVATEVGGIMVINMDTKKCSYINHQFNNSFSISSDNILDIYKDLDNNIWVCTNAGGFDVYVPVMQQFKFYENDYLKAIKANRAQGQSAIIRMNVSKYNNYIYLPHGNGFTIFNTITKQVEVVNTREAIKKAYKPKHGEPLPEAFATSGIIEMSKDVVIVDAGSYKLVYNLKTKSGKLVSDTLVVNEFSQRGGNNNFYVTAHSLDYTKYYIGRFDTINYKMTDVVQIPEGKSTRDNGLLNQRLLYLMDEDNLLIDINQARFDIYNLKTHQFTTYSHRNGLESFPDSMLMILLVDSKGNTWIKGGSGIYKFDYKTGKTEKYNKIIGVERELVQSLIEDKNGILWFALKSDLIRFNPVTNEKLRINKRLGLNAGMFAVQFNFTLPTKNVYVVSPYGLLEFDPEELHLSTIKPNLFVTSVIVNKDTLTQAKCLDFINNPPRLEWNKNFITFEFATSQQYTPGLKRYRYRLIGLDSTWLNNEHRNYVSYTNLDAGDYTLEVICKNSYGVESELLKVPFTIKLPFWKTWWFILIVIVVAIALTGAFFRYRLRKLHADKLKLEKIVDERTSELKIQSAIIQEKNKELTDSIKYAERIQKVLLANDDLMTAGLPSYFVYFQPKDIVSGDFYWATSVTGSLLQVSGSEQITNNKKQETTNNELFFLAICDSTGHGVPGAFMSLLNISFLNEAISEKNILSPDKILNYVREKLITNISIDGARDGMDGTVLCYDKTAKKITYASAHNKPILIRNGKLEELGADKMPIGAGEKKDSFTLHTINLQAGDKIYFYTDGYADQFGGPKGKKFKYKQLNEVLFQSSGETPEKQKEILKVKFEEWRNNLEQIDDVLVAGIFV